MTDKEVAKRGVGRPTLYTPEFHIPAITKLVACGQKSKAQIAASFGVSKNTLRVWEKEHPELEAALQVVSTAGEAHLTDVLYNIAIGELKGNPTAAMMILNNVYGWKSTNSSGGNTEININAENVNLSYNEITNELQKYLEKMGVRNLAELETNIIDVDSQELA